jgi:hypothetical protein
LFVVLGLIRIRLVFSRTAGKDFDGAGFRFVVVFRDVEEVLRDLQLAYGERERAVVRRVGAFGGTIPVTR